MRVSRNRGDVTTAPDRPKAKATAAAARTARKRGARPMRPVADRFGAAKARSFDLPGLLESVSRIRRGSGPEGSEALIGKAERDRVTTLFGALSPARAAAVQQLLLAVPEGAAQALLLKAIAARATRLPGDDRALNVVSRFAKLLEVTAQDELLERGTVLDLDSTVSTSNVDLMPMWSKRGTIRGQPPQGERGDNDGMLQVFTASCGPAIIQMMRGQVDPVLAFAINHQGRTTDSVKGPLGAFQRALLEEFGGIAIGRRESYVLSRLHNAMGRLGLPDRSLSDENIAAVREHYDGFPSAEDLKRVKAAFIPARDEGIGFDEFHSMLERYVSNLNGARYTQTTPPEGFARGQAWRYLDAVERALKAGFDVPFGLVEPAHWLLASDVRGKAPSREYLVSDPDGGRTAWVGEKALVDGSFAKKQFDLPYPHERSYIDSFYLPEAARS